MPHCWDFIKNVLHGGGFQDASYRKSVKLCVIYQSKRKSMKTLRSNRMKRNIDTNL